MRRRTTLADVAAASGVSQAIVSRVLSGRNGTTRFSTSTAERVRRAAQALHYRPNLATRIMRERKTMTLGLAIPGASPAYLKLVPTAIEAAGTLGYELMVTAGSDIEGSDYAARVSRVLDREVDGLIVVPTGAFQQSQVYRELLSVRPPTVLVEHDIRNSGFDFIGMDGLTEYRQIIAYLKQMGHTKIGFIYEMESVILSGHQRLVDFGQAMDEAGLPVMPRWYVQAVDEGSAHGLQRVYGKGSEVTAAVVRGGARLSWACEQFAAMGLRIPQDLSVVNISAHDYSNERVRFDALQTPLAEIGRRCVQALVERINQPDLPPRHETLPGTFRPGETVQRIS